MATRQKGAEFLIAELDCQEQFTPEDINDEQKQILDTTREMVEKEILPHIEAIDGKDFELVKKLLLQTGELGLLMMDATEEDGGLDLDKVTGLLVAEEIARSGSFSVAYTAHTGIGCLPLVYYGTKLQKDKYLDKLMSGEWPAAYCLTEPNSGSDAINVDTTAVLSEDGKHYILNGTKQFITNGGFARFLTVFTKVDKEHFTAFIVESDYEGVTRGPEEHKMGINGSSTTQIILDNVKVPVENLLGELGKGYKIAYIILDVGRLKLGACVNGAAREVIRQAAAYAVERKQFKTSISNFGAIQEKFADQVARLYTSESLVYRCAGEIDKGAALLDKSSPDYMKDYMHTISDYATECSIAKVYCSSMLGELVDEMLQVYGGYGFIEEYPAERAYRDERINRIYEGTNEVNRLLIPGTILKKSLKGEIPLQKEAMKAVEGLLNPSFDLPPEGLFAVEKKLISNLKQVFLVIAGAAVQKFQMALEKEQMLLLAAANIAEEIYAVESGVLRAEKNHKNASDKKKALYEALVKVSCFEAAERLAHAAKKAAFYVEEGDTLAMIQSGVRRYTKYNAEGLLAAKRLIAKETIEQGKYPLER